MYITLLIKIIGLIVLLIWYFQHKYKPFLSLLIVYLLLFASDAWKLIQNIYVIPKDIILLVDRIVIVSGIPVLVIMIMILWKMFKNRQKR